MFVECLYEIERVVCSEAVVAVNGEDGEGDNAGVKSEHDLFPFKIQCVDKKFIKKFPALSFVSCGNRKDRTRH